MKPLFIAAAACLPLALTACSTQQTVEHTGAIPPPRAGDAATDEAMLARLGSLEGEWEMQGEDGTWTTASVFTVSSNGSVVREIMFPGEPHEMTNLYHMDGTDAVVTHYCAIGNQPRMVAAGIDQTADGPSIDFGFDSVSNLRDSHDHVMGGLRLVFVDDNTIQEHWTSLDQQGEVASEMVFNYRRKR